MHRVVICVLVLCSIVGAQVTFTPGGGIPGFSLSGSKFQSYTFWDAGSTAGTSDIVITLFEAYLAASQGTQSYVSHGGFNTFSTTVNGGVPGAPYYVIEGDGTAGAFPNLDVHGTIKIDNSGWAVFLMEVTNTGSSSYTQYFCNNGYDTFVQGLTLYDTESGDTSFDTDDSWAILRFPTPGSPFLAWGGGENLDFHTFRDVGVYTRLGWFQKVTINPGETLGFIVVAGFSSELIESIGAFTQRTRNVLTDGASLKDYVSPNGNRLLAHLSQAQLDRVLNWNVGSGGAGGDPHGAHFDGTPFDFPHIAAAYCLYHDEEFQVNIRVSTKYFITEVVAHDKINGWTIHARLDEQGYPAYFLNDNLLDIPSELFAGKIKTQIGALPRPGPLGELSRYHVNSLVLAGKMTIVGGDHPVIDGFFNVEVIRRSRAVSFPSILQLHGRAGIRGLEDELSQSVLPDVWFFA